MLLLLLFSDRNRFPSTCNPSWGCTLLVVDHGVVFQLVEHLFDSWGCDNHWWDNHWWDNHRWDSLSYLLLEIPINFATVRSPQTLFRIFLESFRPPLKSFQDILGQFQNIFPWIILGQFPENNFSRFLPNMGPLSNSAKTTYIYLSFLVGTNLVLMLSSDSMTVFVGFVCLIMSFSSLASFHLDQVMRNQEQI